MAKRDRIAHDPTEIAQKLAGLPDAQRLPFWDAWHAGTLGMRMRTEDMGSPELEGYEIGLREYLAAQRGRRISAQVGAARHQGGKKKRGEGA